MTQGQICIMFKLGIKYAWTLKLRVHIAWTFKPMASMAWIIRPRVHSGDLRTRMD
jgi:hypothetical protein